MHPDNCPDIQKYAKITETTNHVQFLPKKKYSKILTAYPDFRPDSLRFYEVQCSYTILSIVIVKNDKNSYPYV